MKKRTRRGWAHAVCVDCGWELERINAQAVGAKHAKHHKHRVLVTTELESVYDGRDSLSTADHAQLNENLGDSQSDSAPNSKEKGR